MKKGLYILIILLAGGVSCSESSTSEPSLPDGSSDNFKHEGDAPFKFTNRGIEYDARSNGKEDPLNNVATLQYDPEYGNRLDISAFDADAPAGLSFITGLLITVYLGDGEMKKGSYRFAPDVELIDCKERKFEGCVPISNGTIVPYKHEEPTVGETYSLENALHSVSGELEITEFRLGNFVLGFAEGTISGKFFFDGYSLESSQENPGSASGKFENVKVLAQKR